MGASQDEGVSERVQPGVFCSSGSTGSWGWGRRGAGLETMCPAVSHTLRASALLAGEGSAAVGTATSTAALFAATLAALVLFR